MVPTFPVSSMTSGPDFECVLKIVLLGDPGVGKTSILSRFSRDEFRFGYTPTETPDISTRTLTVPGGKIRVQVWDESGREQFDPMRRVHFRQPHGAIIVFDITERASFHSVARWMNELSSLGEPRAAATVLVGNKSDLGHLRAVSTEEASAFAAQNGIHFVETSARDASNVRSALLAAITGLPPRALSTRITSTS